MKLHRTSTEQV